MARRFYEKVSVAEAGGGDGFIVRLDAHELKTPAKKPLILPTAELAQHVADEWQAQETDIDSHTMPTMRLVSTALDRVAEARDETAQAFAAYGMSDLLCYRAENPDKLVKKQADAWDPLLDWAKHRFDISFEVTQGILPINQPSENEARLITIAGDDVFRLTGLAHMAATLGSAILAIAVDEAHIDAQGAYQLAFLDDLYQIDEWGVDAEAVDRLDRIALAIRLASGYLSALKQA